MKQRIYSCTKQCAARGVSCQCAGDLEFVVDKQRVRRAAQAVDAVIRLSARDAHDSDDGVIIMIALMLIDYLARTRRCDPRVLLAKIAKCLELKHRMTQRAKA